MSQAIQTTDWVIPMVQTVHIVAVAAVMTSALMIDLRLLGLRASDQPVVAVAGRFMPFIWWPLPLLLVSGAALIIAEPSRALQNPVFVLKMSLLAVAVAVTLTCQLPLRKDPRYWEQSPARRGIAKLIACVSLPVWVGILFAGRWIAYVQGS